MKLSLIAGALLLGAFQPGYAGTADVNAHSLETWAVTGDRPVDSTENNGLILPPASRISRLFHSNTVSLKLVTTPAFEEEPEDWPIIEIGSAALALCAWAMKAKRCCSLVRLIR